MCKGHLHSKCLIELKKLMAPPLLRPPKNQRLRGPRVAWAPKKYYLLEKSKKFNFFQFFFRNLYWPVAFDWKFFKFVVKIFKTEWLYLLERFENKSHQRRAQYLKPRRNGGPIPTGGAWGAPLPHWLGLNKKVSSAEHLKRDLLLEMLMRCHYTIGNCIEMICHYFAVFRLQSFVYQFQSKIKKYLLKVLILISWL